uniref:Uncharacterized protein LOC113792027 n=1 Tax=Dermatophagoides pteronyssinus TaxID=6956 RepID=A0A6P6XX38_DERPT|nr:uncharacterized protein LOC113792027 [Dermatophagoides pteronyssinus]
MSWLGLDQLFNLELNKISASISVAIFTILYFIYKRYRQLNRYQNIDENELMLAKLKAARLKQQEIYSQMIKEQAERKQSETATTTKTEHSNDKNKAKNDDDDTLSRDFFPLMNSAPAYYRPIRKKPCGPCGGGGCG